MKAIVTLMIIGDLMMEEDPLEEGNIKKGVEGHWIEKIVIKIEVTLEEEEPQIEIENPLIMEDPLMMEDLLTMEDPLEMDKIQDALEDEDHQAHQDLLDQCILI